MNRDVLRWLARDHIVEQSGSWRYRCDYSSTEHYSVRMDFVKEVYIIQDRPLGGVLPLCG